jgi:hypothetical protein
MPNDVDSSVVPTATSDATASSNKSKVGDGPKYNEDANLLAEGELESPDEDEESETPLVESEEDSDASDEEENPDEDTSEEEDSEKPKIPFDRPTIKELKTEFPELFKKFPQLRESYFREIEFTKLFPTVEDAKEAFEENESFTTLSDSVLSGDPAPLLESIGKTDKKALEIFSMSFLPELYKRDGTMYNQVVTPIFQNLVQALYKDKDENTQNAALVLAEWMFGSDGDGVAKGTKSVAKNIQPTEEQKRLKDTKEEQTATAFRNSAGRVQTTVEKGLESLILKSLSFDPNKVFSPSLRKMGSQEVAKRLMEQLKQDQGHMTVMGARWKRARANGYTTDDESKIVSTYLARAKSLIPSIASKVSSAMLGTKTKAAEKKGEKAITFSKQTNSGRSVSNGKSSNKLDYSKMSDLDILNS